jgi:copper chaperone
MCRCRDASLGGGGQDAADDWEWMMAWTIAVENVKCGGCARSIKSAIGAVAGVTGAEVDVTSGEVRIDGDEAARPAIVQRLRELGYPERGTASGLNSAVAMAKSYVSCAIGKMGGSA